MALFPPILGHKKQKLRYSSHGSPCRVPRKKVITCTVIISSRGPTLQYLIFCPVFDVICKFVNKYVDYIQLLEYAIPVCLCTSQKIGMVISRKRKVPSEICWCQKDWIFDAVSDFQKRKHCAKQSIYFLKAILILVEWGMGHTPPYNPHTMLFSNASCCNV